MGSEFLVPSYASHSERVSAQVPSCEWEMRDGMGGGWLGEFHPSQKMLLTLLFHEALAKRGVPSTEFKVATGRGNLLEHTKRHYIVRIPDSTVVVIC